MSAPDKVDGWLRLSDQERLDRAVKIAREAIMAALADSPPEEREAFFAQWRAMSGNARDQLIVDVFKAKGMSDALIDDIQRTVLANK